MAKLNEELRKAVFDIYNGYISKGLEVDPPFKNAGMQYIRFAKEEPALFKFLFMTKSGDVVEHSLSKNEKNYEKIVCALMDSQKIAREDAERIYEHLSVYTYGIAMLFVQKTGIYTIDDVERMISDLFYALKAQVQEVKI
jgi:hypothetical protein